MDYYLQADLYVEVTKAEYSNKTSKQTEDSFKWAVLNCSLSLAKWNFSCTLSFSDSLKHSICQYLKQSFPSSIGVVQSPSTSKSKNPSDTWNTHNKMVIPFLRDCKTTVLQVGSSHLSLV